jgi:hypothetical protein
MGRSNFYLFFLRPPAEPDRRDVSSTLGYWWPLLTLLLTIYFMLRSQQSQTAEKCPQRSFWRDLLTLLLIIYYVLTWDLSWAKQEMCPPPKNTDGICLLFYSLFTLCITWDHSWFFLWQLLTLLLIIYFMFLPEIPAQPDCREVSPA